MNYLKEIIINNIFYYYLFKFEFNNQKILVNFNNIIYIEKNIINIKKKKKKNKECVLWIWNSEIFSSKF